MGFRKFGEKEKITEILDNEGISVIQSHKTKTGKSIQDFTDEERESLRDDLDIITDKK